MKITLNKVTPKVSFTLLEERFIEAITSCNLGSGTIYDPINVDGFVKINDEDLYTFYAGETIELEFSPSQIPGRVFQLISCSLDNVGKEFNEGTEDPINNWQSVFNIDNKPLIKSLPNGSLSVAPSGGKAAITVINSVSPIERITYVSYSILFLFEFEDRLCYFIIDPLLRISSTRPPI